MVEWRKPGQMADDRHVVCTSLEGSGKMESQKSAWSPGNRPPGEY